MREGRRDCRARVSSEHDETASDDERVRTHALARPIKLTYHQTADLHRSTAHLADSTNLELPDSLRSASLILYRR